GAGLVKFSGGAVFRGARREEWLMGAVAGAALYGGIFFQTEGLRYTSAANSAFITGLCVVMVPFMLWIGGRRPKGRHFAGALLAAAGLYLLTGVELSSSGFGDALTLACAVMFALHIICLGAFGLKMRAARLFTFQLLTAACLAVAAALAWGGPVRWSGRVVVALLVTGVLATSLAFFLQTWAQRRLEPARASLWLLTEPLFALLFGYALLGEIPSYIALAGAAVILAGLAVSETGGTLSARPGRSLSSREAQPAFPGAEFFGTEEKKRVKA
ncbi:MAG: DMT family transporter, partial [bacterium]